MAITIGRLTPGAITIGRLTPGAITIGWLDPVAITIGWLAPVAITFGWLAPVAITTGIGWLTSCGNYYWLFQFPCSHQHHCKVHKLVNMVTASSYTV